MPTSISLSAEIPSQEFTTTLEDRTIDLSFKWNSRMNFWTMDMSENDIIIATGIALKTGAQLLEPFNLGLGGIVVVDTTNSGQELTLTNVNSEVYLIHFTEDELANV